MVKVKLFFFFLLNTMLKKRNQKTPKINVCENPALFIKPPTKVENVFNAKSVDTSDIPDVVSLPTINEKIDNKPDVFFSPKASYTYEK